MCTAHSSDRRGEGLHQALPREQTPRTRHPPDQAPSAARHAEVPPAMHAGIAHTPCEQNDKQV